VLTRNPDAFQIGLTATPRELEGSQDDRQISADNIRHFGDAVYDYSLAQGIEDGYLAPCEIKQGRVSIDETALIKKEVIAHKAKRVDTGRKAGRTKFAISTTPRITTPSCKSPSAWPPCATTCSSTCSKPAGRNRKPSSSARRMPTRTGSPRT
jgi:superfamily II DNA or RNA helicase